MAMILLFVMIYTHLSSGENVIYHLNASEYARMPPLFHLDRYDHCLNEQGGVYCTVSFDLVTDQPNPLYTMIQEYSASTASHFNHTQLQYGLCLTKTCKQFYHGDTISDQRTSLEACLNSSLWNDYTLKAKVPDVTCQKSERKVEFDIYDAIVAAVLVILLLLNLIGSLHEMYSNNSTSDVEGGFWSSFSITRNWKRLTAPYAAGPEPRTTRLKGISGVRSILTALVIIGHSLLLFVLDIDNSKHVEEIYSNKFYSMIFHGTLVVQIFFVLSGFLCSFNVLLYEEKHQLRWDMLPRGIVNRWLRLTPPYAVVLAVTATWLRHAGTGPLWEPVVGSEVATCRRDWWLHLLYINNYVDYSSCMGHTWYLAADFHLYIIGLMVMLTAAQFRKKILTLLFVAGLIMPAAHTYFQDLDVNVVLCPQTARTLCTQDRTFHHVYKRSHTNLASYVIGLTLGMLVYRWLTTDYKFNKYVKLRFLQWLALPAMFAVISLSSTFFQDGPRSPIYLRAPFSGLIKPFFSFIFSFFAVVVIFKFEKFQRGIAEADIWAVPYRVSYCAYLVHMAFIRYLIGIRTTLMNFSFVLMLEIMISTLIMSFLLAILLHLLVEAPIQNLVKYVTTRQENKVSTD